MNPTSQQDASTVFAGGGELGSLMRAFDWSKTPLGLVRNWPQSLKSCVRIILTSHQPMFIWWGDSLITLYNDAFHATLGSLHPGVLGRPAADFWQADFWQEKRDEPAQRVEAARHANKGIHDEARLLILERDGFPEETYHTFSYSSVPDDQGNPGGIICVVRDDTQRIVGTRQLALLNKLATRKDVTRTAREACASCAAILASETCDLPFALIYLQENQQRFVLAGSTGFDVPHPLAPDSIDVDAALPWPLDEVVASGRTRLINLDSQSCPLPCGAWSVAASRALILPVAIAGGENCRAAMVVGLNPFRKWDDSYQSFLSLVAAHVCACISAALACHSENRRNEMLAQPPPVQTRPTTQLGDKLMAAISHDLRSPLNVITMAASYLERKLEPASGATAQLARILSAANRMSQLITDLVDITSLDTGSFRIDKATQPVAPILDEVNDACRSDAQEKNVGIRIAVEPGLPLLACDRARLLQALSNLLQGMIKFMPFGGQVRLEARCSGEQLHLAISGTGAVIAREAPAHSFVQHRHLDQADWESQGLGLAVAKGIIEAHSGSICLQSDPEQGSTFLVELPWQPAPDGEVPATNVPICRPGPIYPSSGPALAADEQTLAQLQTEATPSFLTAGTYAQHWPELPQPLRSARILVVDDSADFRTYLSGLLGRLFNKVEVAENGAQAWQSVRKNPPDLILSDVMMPVMDGYQLVRRLREDERTRLIPVILLSARDGEQVDDHSGADDYLAKPFSPSELVSRIRSQLETAQARREVLFHELAAQHLLASLIDRDEFLSLAAHELRTPVAALQLQIQNLTHGPLSERLDGQLRARLNSANRSVGKLVQLVNTMLDISRLGSGSTKLVPEQADLRQLAMEVLQQFATDIRLSGSQISLKSDKPVVGIWDISRIKQIISNLLSNALKYGLGKPIEIEIQADGGKARLIIRDMGMGLGTEHQMQIFQRFRRIGSTRHFGGFGLGLWIVRELVDLMGGSVEVQSSPNQGATFVVELPRSLKQD